MTELLQDPNQGIFYWAIAIVIFIGLVEGLGSLIGSTISNVLDTALNIDVDIDFDLPDHSFSSIVGWLMFGKLPFMMVVIIFLTAFGLGGMIVQETTESLFGFYWPQFLAGVVATVIALPTLHYVGEMIASVMPKTESYSICEESFIGKKAVITVGTARVGRPTEAKFEDGHGQVHYVIVEPKEVDVKMPQGSSVILTEKNGSGYYATTTTTFNPANK